MISNQQEYEKTRQYVDNLQSILPGLRQQHSESEYAFMSRAYLKELTRAQREIVRFFATDRLSQKA